MFTNRAQLAQYETHVTSMVHQQNRVTMQINFRNLDSGQGSSHVGNGITRFLTKVSRRTELADETGLSRHREEGFRGRTGDYPIRDQSVGRTQNYSRNELTRFTIEIDLLVFETKVYEPRKNTHKSRSQ